MPWLTGNATAPVIGRRLLIPDDETFLAAVRGALLDLTKEQNWQQFGTVTPAQAAAAALEMLLSMGVETMAEGVRLRRTNSFLIAPNSDVIVPYEFAEYDTSGYWSSSFAGRVSIAETGLYVVSFQMLWASDAGQFRRGWVVVGDGSTEKKIMQDEKLDLAIPGSVVSVGRATTVKLNAGEYLRSYARHNAPVNQTFLADEDAPVLAVVRVG